MTGEELRKLAGDGMVELGAHTVTHPVLSGPASERLLAAPFKQIVVTNTIPLRPEAQRLKNLRQLTMAPLIAQAIDRVHRHDSLSTLFT